MRRTGRPRRLADEGREEIERVAKLRADLPTDKQLADKWHISRKWVSQLMYQARRPLKRTNDVSCGTQLSDTPSQPGEIYAANAPESIPD